MHCRIAPRPFRRYNSGMTENIALPALPVTLEDEMRRSYLDYAMSVIVSRALPDVRDGLKPVHRRILFSMHESGYNYDKPYRKSARVVGDVIGKYHPHGDQAVYDALVRMAQDFSMRTLLIDGQGNFGSPDSDPAAAMRYTEVRMTQAAALLMSDLDKETVPFRPNYDGQEHEPTVMPAQFPNLLINGASGIAVGMATNIPPHNPNEIIDACLAMLDNPNITFEELLEIVPAPDFPTGGMIVGGGGARLAYSTGRGSVLMRGRVHVEEIGNRTAVVIDDIPYQINKPAMIEKIAHLVRDKQIEGISDLRDESSREGIRVVVELKRDAPPPDLIIRQLYRYTELEKSFPCNMLVLNGGRPEQMGLAGLLRAFLDFREQVVGARLRFLLNKARDRAHVLCALATAVEHLDDTVRMIRGSRDAAEARQKLLNHVWQGDKIAPYVQLIDSPDSPLMMGDTYRLTERQVKAILDLRLQRLTALGRDEITNELVELAKEIKHCLYLLGNREALLALVREELVQVRQQLNTPRRTQIIPNDDDDDDEQLIAREDMVVVMTARGYIVRVSPDEYRTQHRGGRGKSGMNTRDEDAVTTVFSANTHTEVLFFSNLGKVYALKVYRLPQGSANSRGKPLLNLLPLVQGEIVTAVLPRAADMAGTDLIFATAAGNIRRNAMADFEGIPRRGKIAMKLDDDDTLIAVHACAQGDDLLMATTMGRAVRCPVTEVRVFKGRDSSGVRGIKLLGDDKLLSLSVVPAGVDTAADDETDDNSSDEDAVLADSQALCVFVMTSNGYGKRTPADSIRRTRRGSQGVRLIRFRGNETASLRAVLPVQPTDDIVAVTDGGQMIRFPAAQVSLQGRTAGGVTLFRLPEGESTVSAVAITGSTPDEDVV